MCHVLHLVKGSVFVSVHSKRSICQWIVLLIITLSINTLVPYVTVAFEITQRMSNHTIQQWHTDAESYVRLDSPIQSPFTGQTTVAIGSEFMRNIEQFVMLGLSSNASTSPDMLSLVWEKDPNSWWVAWRLMLVAGPNVVIDGETGASIELARAAPTSHHTYEAALSYDEETNSLSVAVVNVTSKQPVTQAFFEAYIPAKHVWLHSGVQTDKTEIDEANVHVQRINTLGQYIPVGTQWDRIIEGADGSALPGQRIHGDDTLAVTLHTSALPKQSGFRLTAADASTNETLFTSEHIAPNETMRIPANDLPFGTLDIFLEYVIDDTVYLRDTKQLQVGYIDVVYEKVAPDFENNVLRGAVRVMSPANIKNVPFRLTGSVAEWIWDDTTQQYTGNTMNEYTLYDADITLTGKETLALPFSIPLPEQPGTWQFEFALQTPITHSIRKESQHSLFSTTYQGEIGALRVCSYNIYGFDGWPEDIARKTLGSTVNEAYFAHFADVIKELNCDITGLQEAHSSEWLRILASRTDNNVAISSTRTSFPGGILTTYPIAESRDYVSGAPSGDVPFSRTAGAALLDIHGHDVWVINIHAHPNREELRKEEARLLGDYVDELLSISPHIIVLGDFNSIPDTVIHQALTQRGFLNTMELGADRYYPTMNQRSGGTGVRAIDHIYVSESLAGTVRNSMVYDAPGFRMPNIPEPDTWLHSDHLPVVTELEW